MLWDLFLNVFKLRVGSMTLSALVLMISVCSLALLCFWIIGWTFSGFISTLHLFLLYFPTCSFCSHSPNYSCFVLFFWAGFHITKDQAGCVVKNDLLCPAPGAGVTGIYKHAWFLFYEFWNVHVLIVSIINSVFLHLILTFDCALVV